MSVSGQTLIAEFWGPKEPLVDLKKLYDLLMDTAEISSLRPITAPMILRWDVPQAKAKEEWGYTGILVLAESHIAFHTWPEYGYMSFVLSSCKAFEDRKVVSYVLERFGSSDYNARVQFMGIPPEVLRKAKEAPLKKPKIVDGKPTEWLEKKG